MVYEIKDNTFSLFANDKKGSDKRPDWSGKGKVDGVDVRIAVWKRTTQNGVEYLFGTIEETTKSDMPQEEPGALDDHILC